MNPLSTTTLLFTSPGCPHCPGLKSALNNLLQEGKITSLEIVDASVASERAQALGVKSVPWFRIGALQFEGTMTLGELRIWAQRAASASGLQDYFFEMLKSGRRDKVEDMIRADPQRSIALADLMLDPEASMAVRIGIGAVLEELQGSGLTAPMAPKLGEILRDPNPRNRADAAHYLSLIGSAEAFRLLRDCLDDPDAAVREIAYDALSNAPT